MPPQTPLTTGDASISEYLFRQTLLGAEEQPPHPRASRSSSAAAASTGRAGNCGGEGITLPLHLRLSSYGTELRKGLTARDPSRTRLNA